MGDIFAQCSRPFSSRKQIRVVILQIKTPFFHYIVLSLHSSFTCAGVSLDSQIQDHIMQVSTKHLQVVRAWLLTFDTDRCSEQFIHITLLRSIYPYQ